MNIIINYANKLLVTAARLAIRGYLKGYFVGEPAGVYQESSQVMLLDKFAQQLLSGPNEGFIECL